MMEIKCANCPFWTLPETVEDFRKDFGHCRKTPHADDIGEWDEDGDWVASEEYRDRTALACDASGYYATLITKAEHCCSMHPDWNTRAAPSLADALRAVLAHVEAEGVSEAVVAAYAGCKTGDKHIIDEQSFFAVQDFLALLRALLAETEGR